MVPLISFQCTEKTGGTHFHILKFQFPSSSKKNCYTTKKNFPSSFLMPFSFKVIMVKS